MRTQILECARNEVQLHYTFLKICVIVITLSSNSWIREMDWEEVNAFSTMMRLMSRMNKSVNTS